MYEFWVGHNLVHNMEYNRRIKDDTRVLDLVESTLSKVERTVGEDQFKLNMSSMRHLLDT